MQKLKREHQAREIYQIKKGVQTLVFKKKEDTDKENYKESKVEEREYKPYKDHRQKQYVPKQGKNNDKKWVVKQKES